MSDSIDSIDTSEADARPWTPDATVHGVTLTPGEDFGAHLRGQLLVLAGLLRQALEVVKNVDAEGCDEAELLQHLITQGDAAVLAVLQEHAAPQPTAVHIAPRTTGQGHTHGGA